MKQKICGILEELSYLNFHVIMHDEWEVPHLGSPFIRLFFIGMKDVGGIFTVFNMETLKETVLTVDLKLPINCHILHIPVTGAVYSGYFMQRVVELHMSCMYT